jgi:hypothetical protein
MDDRSNSNQLNITLYPFSSWGFGILWLVFTGFILLRSNFSFPGSFVVLLFVLIPAAIFVLTPAILTISADKITRILTIKTVRPIFGANVTEIPLDEIADCQLQNQQAFTNDRMQTVYRIALVKKSGEIVPVTRSFSTGRNDKAETVRRLVAFLGLPGKEATESPSLEKAQPTLQTTVDPIRAPFGQSWITAGITWRIEKYESSATTIVRWSCSDFTWPGRNFLMVLQQSFSASTKLSRFLFGLSRKNLPLVFSTYRFPDEDLPDVEDAVVLPPNPQLDTDFFCISNAPDAASKLLNAEITNTLLHWAQRHPGKTMGRRGEMMQMIVLFSPRGTYLSTLGNPTPTELDDMIALGVEIVHQAQRAVMPGFFNS